MECEGCAGKLPPPRHRERAVCRVAHPSCALPRFRPQLAEPTSIYINRGNHEQRDLNERPFQNGGGFAWELREKYPHDEHLIEFFQRAFVLFPIAALVGQWAFVIHGGLFRQEGVTLDDIKNTDHRRQPPLKLETRDDEILFDALWADPHEGTGVVQGSTRGGFSIQFGSNVTKDFCKRTGVKSVIRSHQLPKKMRGFEILHDSMLLTIFSASNYGGVCRNRGGVLVFDEKGPAEVKEFYAPTLEQFREMYDTRVAQKVMSRVGNWRKQASLDPLKRISRQKRRENEEKANKAWVFLVEEVNEKGVLNAQAQAEVQQQANKLASRASSGPYGASLEARKSKHQSRITESDPDQLPDRSSLRRHSLVSAPLRGDNMGRESSQRIHQVVFTDEMEGTIQKDNDIRISLLSELCRRKGQLMTAFSAAELAENGAASPNKPPIERHKSAASELPYDRWLDVLCQCFPVYSSLWREYAPKLTQEGAVVPYRRWLDRFQVPALRTRACTTTPAAAAHHHHPLPAPPTIHNHNHPHKSPPTTYHPPTTHPPSARTSPLSPRPAPSSSRCASSPHVTDPHVTDVTCVTCV